MWRGWHTAVMTNAPPPNPRINEVWVDDDGVMKRFNGSDWVPYLDMADSPLYGPNVIEKIDVENSDDDQGGE
jgi:hypothetical protein